MRIGVFDKFPNSYKMQELRVAATHKSDVQLMWVPQWHTSWFGGRACIGKRDSVQTEYDVLFVSNLGRESERRAQSRLALLQELNKTLPVVNDPRTIRQFRSKISSSLTFHQKGYLTPRTWVVERIEDILSLLEEEKKLVLKPDVSSKGEGVILLRAGQKDLLSLLEYHSRNYSHGVSLLQEYVKSDEGSDYRVLSIGNQIIGSVRRTPSAGSLTSNAARGGTAVKCDDPDLHAAAERILENLPRGFYALDFIKTHAQFLLLEVNTCPGWQAFRGTTGKDVASMLVNFLHEVV